MLSSGARPHMAALIEDMELHRAGHEGGVPASATAGHGAVVSVEGTGGMEAKVGAAASSESTTPSAK